MVEEVIGSSMDGPSGRLVPLLSEFVTSSG